MAVSFIVISIFILLLLNSWHAFWVMIHGYVILPVRSPTNKANPHYSHHGLNFAAMAKYSYQSERP